MINRSESYHPRFIITNYKLFKQETEIILAPLTILVGPNGGGKSSIIFAIQLFSRSLQYILNGDKEAKLKIESIPFDELISVKSSNKKNITLAIADDQGEWIKINYCRGKNGGVKIKYFLLRIFLPEQEIIDERSALKDTRILLKISPEKFNSFDSASLDKITNELSNVQKYLDYGGGGLFFKLVKLRQKLDQSSEYKFVDTVVHNKNLPYSSEIIKSIEIVSSSYFTQLYRIEPIADNSRLVEPIIYWATIILSADNEILIKAQNHYPQVYDLLKNIFDSIYNTIEDWTDYLFNKLDDTRKDPPEYYEYKNGIVSNDYYNLCDYLLNGIEVQSTDPDHHKKVRKGFIKHLQGFEIADDIKVKELISIKPDHKFYSINLLKNQELFNLSKLSSGGKQILPVILKLFVQLNSFENLMISQPELHLHPKLQGKIPDVLVDFFNNISIAENQIILVETHSEHLIRKLQVLIAQKKFNNNNIAVSYIIPQANAFESEAIYLPMNEKGLFTKNWPDGFFNDATILTLDLLEELTKRQN